MSSATNRASAPPSADPVSPGANLGTPRSDRGSSLHDAVRTERWTARGVAKVVGSVEVGVADLDGFVIVGEGFLARELSARGTLEVGGALDVRGELALHGSLRAGRGLHAGVATLAGSVRTDGPVAVDGRWVLHGSLSAPAASASETRLAGLIRLAGELRTSTAELDLDEASRLGSVVGRSVRVRGPDGGMIDRLLGRFRHAYVEHIEAETVELERVEVGSVVAREAILGRECHVGRLEVGKVHAHASSRVGPESRSPPPQGLRR